MQQHTSAENSSIKLALKRSNLEMPPPEAQIARPRGGADHFLFSFGGKPGSPAFSARLGTIVATLVRSDLIVFHWQESWIFESSVPPAAVAAFEGHDASDPHVPAMASHTMAVAAAPDVSLADVSATPPASAEASTIV